MRHYSALDFKFFITIQVDFIYNCTFLHLQDIFSKATYKRGTKAIHPGALYTIPGFLDKNRTIPSFIKD